MWNLSCSCRNQMWNPELKSHKEFQYEKQSKINRQLKLICLSNGMNEDKYECSVSPPAANRAASAVNTWKHLLTGIVIWMIFSTSVILLMMQNVSTERTVFSLQLSPKGSREWCAADGRHLNASHCWPVEINSGKPRICAVAACKSCSIYWEQMATLLGVDLLCGIYSNSFKLSVSQRSDAASPLLLRGKGVPSDRRQHICCQALIPFWKCVAMPPKHFPFCVCSDWTCAL